MKKYLVRFNFGLRDAFGESIEVLNEEDMELLRQSVINRQNVYLGEIEGKHSEVSGVIEASDFEIISENLEEIVVFEKLLKGCFGAFCLMDAIREAIKEGR